MRDYETAKLLPLGIIVRPLSIEQHGNERAVIFEDGGARPMDMFRPADLQSMLETIGLAVDSLDTLHSCGVVHGNLMPQNLWRKPNERAIRLFDFSRAVRSGGAREAEAGSDSDLRYKAPELLGQARLTADHRSDYYALGVVLYQWLTGRLPFDSADPAQVVRGHTAQVPPPPATLVPSIPENVAAIALKLLAKDPRDRYQTASDLRADVQAGMETLLEPPSHPPQRRKIRTMKFADEFYGREKELSILSQSWDRACRGEKQVVLIAGRTGVGKSALMARLRQAAADKRGYFIAGKFDQYKRNIPYAAAPEAFQQLVSILLCESEEKLARWRERLSSALGANGRVIIDVIPDIERIIGPQPPIPELGPLESRNRFYRVFRDFAGALASADHPICVLIDDLQWADAASLGLLEMVLADPAIGHIMLLAAYRSNEVDESHPAMMSVRAIEKTGAQVQIIPLSGLGASEINGFVAGTLECSRSASLELATHIYGKTEGNPFFVRQLLQAFYQRDLIVFDRGRDEWTWDMAGIRASGITDDVAELMRDKVGEFPLDARQCLMAAACLGNSFTLNRLAMAMGQTAQFVSSSLRPVIDAGFLAEAESDSAPDRNYWFVHDRVQQAAYGLIPESELQRFRLEIGRRLLASLSSSSATVEQLDVVNNLNHGLHLIVSPSERNQLARLNLAAGRAARESLACREALNYLRHGKSLLAPDAWQENHQLAFDIHRECFECEYQTGNVEEADSLFEILLDRAASRVQKAEVYYTKVLLNTSAARYEEAIGIGIEALNLFGIRLPRSPSKRHLITELVKAKILTFRRPIAEIAALPPMGDLERVAFTRILMAMLPPAYFVDPNILMLAGLKILTTSLRHGNAPVSAIGYVLYGLAQVAALGEIRSGHAFGQLAAEISARFGDVSVRTKTLVIHGGFVRFWRDPIDASIDMLREAYTLALSSGDFQYANYAVLQIVFLSFARGARLDAVASECDRFKSFVRETKDLFAIDSLAIWQQSVRALRGETKVASNLSSAGFDEALTEDRLRKQKNLTALGYFLIRKLHLAYMFDDYDAAYGYGVDGEQFVELLPGQILVAEHSLYFGLTLVAMLRREHPRSGSAWRALKRCDRRLRRSARFAPQNFEHMSRLLSAEIASLNASGLDVIGQYDQAIESARKGHFTHIEALASECAASYCLGRGPVRVVQAYLQDSLQAYQLWGATAKVRHMESRAAADGVLLPSGEPTAPAGAPSARSGIQEALDLSAVFKASNVLSSEVELPDLLNKLITIVLENVGAERGVIVLRESGRLMVRVAADGSNRPVSEPVPLEESPHASVAIVNFAMRTGDVVVGEAASDDRFRTCAYVREKKPRSVLCMPIVKQEGEVLGVLYLENNLIAGAFAEFDVRRVEFDLKRIEVLRVIMKSAAASIENARMYSQLRLDHGRLRDAVRKTELLEQIKVQLEKFVPGPAQRLIRENPEAPDSEIREKDISVMFLDIQDYTQLCERLDSEKKRVSDLIQRYFSAFREELRRYAGDLNVTTGDGCMMVFEDPELNAIRAVDTALAIREKTAALNRELAAEYPPLVINFGITSGLASVGFIKIESEGGALWMYSASGPTVNLAARICKSCRDGDVLISEATARRVSGRFELATLGMQSFKNVSEPECIYRVEVAKTTVTAS